LKRNVAVPAGLSSTGAHATLLRVGLVLVALTLTLSALTFLSPGVFAQTQSSQFSSNPIAKFTSNADPVISITTSNGATVCASSFDGTWNLDTDTCSMGTLTIPSGTIIDVGLGVTIASSVLNDNTGLVNCLSNHGTINNYGSITGTCALNYGIINDGTINNHGAINGDDQYCSDCDGVNNAGTLNNYATLTGISGGGYGIVNEYGTLNNYGNITGRSAGSQDYGFALGQAGFDNYVGVVFNAGTITGYSGYGVGTTNEGTINNVGTIIGSGPTDAGIENQGTINDVGTIIGTGAYGIYNPGTFNNYCGVTESGLTGPGGTGTVNSVLCYPVTFDQSGIPSSGVTWGVVASWGPFSAVHYTGAGASIEGQAEGTFTYSYDTPVTTSQTVYYCQSACSGSETISGAITVAAATYLAIPMTTTTTSVSCSPSPASVGLPTTCTAIVSGNAPSGNVTFASSTGSGSFTPSNGQCILSSSGSCSVTYIPSSLERVIITGAYGGDLAIEPNSPSSNTFSLETFALLTASSGSTLCPNYLGGSWDGATNTCSMSGTLTVSSGSTLNVDSGVTLTVSSSGNDGVDNYGTINNHGTISGTGSLNDGIYNDGTIFNTGTMSGSGVYGAGFANSGVLNNEGTISGSASGSASDGVANGGTINNAGSISGRTGGDAYLGGYDISNQGTITNYCSGSLSFSSQSYSGLYPTFVSCYTTTFDESGLPTGSTWGVTVSWGPFSAVDYTGTGSSVVVQASGALTYSYDTPVTSPSSGEYNCISSCSGSATIAADTTLSTASYLSAIISITTSNGAVVCLAAPLSGTWDGSSNTCSSTAFSIPPKTTLNIGPSVTIAASTNGFVAAVSNSGTINNYGSISGSGLYVYGVENSGTINNYGSISGSTNYVDQSAIYNTGTINNAGTLNGNGRNGAYNTGIDNSGTINNDGTVIGTGSSAAGIYNTGTFNNVESVSGSGSVGIASESPNFNDYCGASPSGYFFGYHANSFSCYSVNFNQNGIPTSGANWGVTVSWSPASGVTFIALDHTSTEASIQVRAIGSLTYSFDSPVTTSTNTYICNSSCSGSSTISGTTTFPSASYATTSTALVCAPASVAAGSSAICTVNVSGATGSIQGETVSFTSSSSTGVFNATSCQLSSSDSCSVTYQDATSGAPVITANYAGDSNNGGSSASYILANFAVQASSAESSSTTLTGGSTTVDQSSQTGISTTISGSGGNSATVFSADLGSTQPAGTGTISLSNSQYYDVKVNGISTGTATVCITISSQLSSQYAMQYWDGSSWVNATNITVSGSQICGDIPVSALTGTNIVIGQMSYSVTFEQSGIPSGVTWSVTVGSNTYTTQDADVIVPNLEGTLSYTVQLNVLGSSDLVQYECISSACSGSITSSSGTVSVSYQAQYLISFAQTGSAATVNVQWDFANGTSGTTSAPFSIWADASTPTLTYSFPASLAGSSGIQYELTSPVSPYSIASGPVSISAAYQTQYLISFTQAGSSVPVSVSWSLTNGTSSSGTVPFGIWVDASNTNTLSYTFPTSISGGAGIQYELTSPTLTSPVPLTSTSTLNGDYQIQYLVTFQQAGSVSQVSISYGFGGGNTSTSSLSAGSGIWVDGTTTSLIFSYPSSVAASVGTQYELVTIDHLSPLEIFGPVTITAQYQAQYLISFIQQGSVPQVSVNWQFSNGTSGTATTPFKIWADASSSNALAYQYELSVPGTTGVQYELESASPNTLTTISAPANIVGTYQTQYLITFAQVGSGTPFAVAYDFGNGTTGSIAVGSGLWTDSTTTSITFSYPSSVVGISGTQYELLSLDHASPYTIASGPVTITAQYQTQYQISFAQIGSGSAIPINWQFVNGTKGAGTAPFAIWIDASSSNSLTYEYPSSIAGAAGVQYELTTVFPASLASISIPLTIVGNYQTQYLITFLQSGSASPVTVSYGFGAGNASTGTANAGNGIWVDATTQSISFTYPATVTGAPGTRYALTSVDTASPMSITGPSTITGTYRTQYLLIVTTNPLGLSTSPTVSPITTSGYYDAGTQVSLTANIESGYVFICWQVDGTNQTLLSNTTRVTMNGAHTAIAVYETPTNALQTMISTVNEMNLQHGIQNSLDAKLNAAIGSLNSGYQKTATNQLNAFIKEVNAQSGKQITSTDAAELVLFADLVINSI
jgi:hypothetical protein